MFDAIQGPTQQDSKLKSAAWAQPVTEVYESAPKTFHPVKVTTPGGNNRLGILLGVLFLLLVGGGAYWWFMMRTTESPIVEAPIVNNIVTTVEEKPTMEEATTTLVFPDDYFLSEEEVPKGFEEDMATGKEEIDNMDDIQLFYDNADIGALDKGWVVTYQKMGDVYLTVAILKYKSNDMLDLEISKILDTKEPENSYKMIYTRKDDVLLLFFSRIENAEELDLLTEIYNKKLDTVTIRELEGEKDSSDKNNNGAIKANLAALPAAGNYYYNLNSNSYLDFCADKSVDGTEANINSVSEFKCLDSEVAWAASGKLDKGYFCIDSSGFQKTTMTEINTFSCSDLEVYTEESLDSTEDQSWSETKSGAPLRSYEAIAMERNFILCYLLRNPQDIDYFPEIDLKQENVNAINGMELDARALYIEEECTDNETFLNDFEEDLHQDTDGDGFSKYFENLYGSDDMNKDTDGDGYDDLTEVENGYSPILNEAEIEQYTGGSGNVYIEYVNSDANFSLWMPKDWTQIQRNNSMGEYRMLSIEFCPELRCKGSELINVIYTIMPGSEDELLSMAPKGEVDEYVLGGSTAHISKDRHVVSLGRVSSTGESIESFVISHENTNGERNPEYIKIFEEMLASFKFLE